MTRGAHAKQMDDSWNSFTESMRISRLRDDLTSRLRSLLFQGVISFEEEQRIYHMVWSSDLEMMNLADVLIGEKSKEMQI